MRRTILPALAFCIAAVACQPATTELTEEQKAAIADTVNALLDDYWDAWRDVDFDRGMSFFLDAPETAFASADQVDYGLATLDSKYRPFMATFESQEITLADSRTTVLASNAVYTMQRGTYVQTDTAGVVGDTLPFAYSMVWVRRNGEWKVLAGHQSDAPSQ